MTSILLWKDIIQIAEKISKIFDLKNLDKIIPETHKLTERYGQLDACKSCREKDILEGCKHKILSIRLNKLGKRKKHTLLQKTILDTLAHELAHLKYWNHGKKHREFTKEIKVKIREMGYEL